MAASRTLCPFSVRTNIVYATTIPLSTNNPKEIIKAAKETLFKPISNRYIKKNEASITIGTRAATKEPVLNPRNMSITIKTISIL